MSGGTCAAISGSCVGQAPANDGARCDDRDACTQVDACQQGVCVGGSPVSCTSGVAGTCTAGSCLPVGPPPPTTADVQAILDVSCIGCHGVDAVAAGLDWTNVRAIVDARKQLA